MSQDAKAAQWREENEAKIRDTFDLFDKDKADSIMPEDVGTVLRALGIYISNSELNNLIPTIRDDAVGGYITYKALESAALRYLNSKEYESSSSNQLLSAFRVIDTQETGFISAEILEELISTKGNPFRPKELEAFLKVARDADTGNVYYEDYVAHLFKK